MEARSHRRGYVAGNLIAAFVTGADGNFDAVIKFFFIPLQLDSIFCFYFYVFLLFATNGVIMFYESNSLDLL